MHRCLRVKCEGLNVPTDMGHMAHYRYTCAGTDENKCDQFRNHVVEDSKILLDHGVELVERTNIALMLEQSIFFFQVYFCFQKIYVFQELRF